MRIKKNQLIKSILSTVAVLSWSATVYADFMGSTNVNRIRVHTTGTYVGFNPQPANTCSSFGEHMKFDHTTESGKAFLSTLLSAKVSGKQVHLWYIASSAPGTNQTNGCGEPAIAVMTGVGIP